MIEYEKTNIYVVENILDNSFCEKVIKLIDKLPSVKLNYSYNNNVKCHLIVLNELLQLNDDIYYKFQLDSQMLPLKDDNIYINNLNGISQTQLFEINNEMNGKMKLLSDIMKYINWHIKFDHSGFLLRKIYGETRLHVDGCDIHRSNITFIDEVIPNYEMIRNSSIIFGLNDDYDDGIFSFPYHNINIKLKKGSVIIFPPYWTHPHNVSNLNDTFRYTISTWSFQNLK